MGISVGKTDATFTLTPGSCCDGLRCRQSQQIFFSGYEVKESGTRVKLLYHNSTAWGQIVASTFVGEVELPQVLARALSTVPVHGEKLLFLRFEPRLKASVMLGTENLRKVEPRNIGSLNDTVVYKASTESLYKHKAAILLIPKNAALDERRCEALVCTLGNILECLTKMCCRKSSCNNTYETIFTDTDSIGGILRQGSNREKIFAVLNKFFEKNLDLSEPYQSAVSHALISKYSHAESIQGNQIPIFDGMKRMFGIRLNLQKLHDTLCLLSLDDLKQELKTFPSKADIYYMLENDRESLPLIEKLTGLDNTRARLQAPY
ncbi:hypothetical protein HDE_12493 [Halotydeus destructor]|nr:hypothetical protein HDE_12493 [Halotydeus destructor]